MRTEKSDTGLSGRVEAALLGFTQWLAAFGEVSFDHQSYFAGPVGGRAKALYYRNRLLGAMAVAPMIFSEAFLPAARRLFHRPLRFPIADAHYAMGFAFLFDATRKSAHLNRAVHFLAQLKASRCPQFEDYCWGYPFDWVTRNGVMKENTPLITSTPYVYEAFLQVFRLEPADERKQILKSIVRHGLTDIKDFETSQTASTCSYTPFDRGGVINAAAYRAFMLTSASQVFRDPACAKVAERNLNFVLENQNLDGSWYYAVDGVRNFVDHFHTCFVMKALGKIYALTSNPKVMQALEKGVRYYMSNLFGADGMPQPFAKAPRLTVYRCELYDCAECINLCLLLRSHFPDLQVVLDRVVTRILGEWIKPDGSFRSRRLLLGWDNVPMHRWAQSQMFRSLAFYLSETTSRASTAGGAKTSTAEVAGAAASVNA